MRWFLLGLTGLISLMFKGLSRVSSNTTVWKHQFFGAQPALWSNSAFLHDYWKCLKSFAQKYHIKSSNCDRGEQKCSILEMHLELKDQQLKASLFIYRLLYQNLMVTWNQKSIGLAKEFIQVFGETQMNTLANPIQQIYTQVKKKELRHNTKLNHQITRGLKRKGRKKAYRNKSETVTKNGNKNMLITNYFKHKWIKCSNQKTQTGWMDKTTRPVCMLSLRDPLQM